MGKYVNLTLRTGMYLEIINILMNYCSELEEYSRIEDMVHLIDSLEGEYQYDIVKQDKKFKELEEYEKLFNEQFEDGVFHDDGDTYMNFQKVNKVLEDYKEGGTLGIFDTKQQFFLVLDLIKSMGDVE